MIPIGLDLKLAKLPLELRRPTPRDVSKGPSGVLLGPASAALGPSFLKMLLRLRLSGVLCSIIRDPRESELIPGMEIRNSNE